MSEKNQDLAEQEMIKQTPAKLYVLVPNEKPNGVRFTLLSTENMHSFDGVAPTKEILQAHFEAERIRMEIAKRDNPDEQYIPQPLYIDTTKEVLDGILEECKTKYERFDKESNFVALSLGVQIPCCIIGLRDDEKPEK